jgi:hypothetical protein
LQNALTVHCHQSARSKIRLKNSARWPRAQNSTDWKPAFSIVEAQLFKIQDGGCKGTF